MSNLAAPDQPGWRDLLWRPLVDAALDRAPRSEVFQRHARSFPAALVEAETQAGHARAFGFAVDDGWIERRVICESLDRHDNFARLLRRPLATRQRLEVQGEWPNGVFVALGLHWGAGFPALEHLLLSQRQPAFVYLAEPEAALNQRARRLYDRLHLRALNGFGHTIPVGGAYQRIKQALVAGRIPVVLFDAPPQPGSSRLSLHRDGFDIALRRGILGLIAKRQIPYVFFRCGWRPGQARRVLEISSPRQSSALEDVAAAAGDFLLDSLRLDGAQWHLWPVASELLRAAAKREET